jgi:hypothetical protein
MRIYLADQSHDFPKHLEYLKMQPVIKYEVSSLIEKITSVDIRLNKDWQKLNTGFFFDYEIFPSHIMSFLTQWAFENRQMQIGDTIVQQAFIPPFQRLSQKIVFGVRINKIINEPARIGFSYETLLGHVEMGVSEFTIQKTEDNNAFFKIHTFSRPGTLLTKLVGPIFAVPYQTYCTKQGLLNVKRKLESF